MATEKIMVWEDLPASDPQKPVIAKYVTEYKKRHGVEPGAFGANAYDAIQLILNAVKIVGPDPVKIRDAIENTKNLVLCTGTFNMSPKDHHGLSANDFVIAVAKDGKFRLLE
jgi:branched-chain amino acid transport system substrate-binding protein